MDALLIVMFNLLGIASFALAVLAQRAPMAISIFAYFGGFFLFVDSLHLIATTDAHSILEWQGRVEMSPFSAVIVLIGLTIWHEGGAQWNKKSAPS
jgi:hypothetical protein